jgi:hypothetical protein
LPSTILGERAAFLDQALGSDVRALLFITKSIFTLLVVASFCLLALGEHGYPFNLAQCILTAVIGLATFGVGWLNQRL